MDTTHMKERNYRMVEMLRHQNEREQRRLEASLYSSGGLEANHRYALENMSREQQLIKQELGRLRQTTTTTWGVLPPRPGEAETPQDKHPQQKSHRGRRDSKARKRSLEEKKQAEQRKQAEAVRKFHEEVDREGRPEEEVKEEVKEAVTEEDKKSAEQAYVPRLPMLPETATLGAEDDGISSRTTNRSTPAADIALVDINVHDAKDNVAKRLVTSISPEKSEQPMTTSPPVQRPPPALSPVRETEMEDEPKPLSQPSPQLKKSQKKVQSKAPASKSKTKLAEQPAFDELRYNPDGSLRTVHTLPDFQSSLREAMKARYLRMKGAQWIERELSNSEIFGKKRTKTSSSTKSKQSS